MLLRQDCRGTEGTLSRKHVTYSKTARSMSFSPLGQLKATSTWAPKTLVSWYIDE